MRAKIIKSKNYLKNRNNAKQNIQSFKYLQSMLIFSKFAEMLKNKDLN